MHWQISPNILEDIIQTFYNFSQKLERKELLLSLSCEGITTLKANHTGHGSRQRTLDQIFSE